MKRQVELPLAIILGKMKNLFSLRRNLSLLERISKPYKQGELVLYRIPFHSKDQRHKLAPRFRGPCEIIECISAVTYKLKDVNSPKERILAHVSQLRPFYHSDRVIFNSKHGNSKDVETTKSNTPKVTEEVTPLVFYERPVMTQAELQDCIKIYSPTKRRTNNRMLASTPEGGEPPSIGKKEIDEQNFNKLFESKLEESKDFSGFDEGDRY